MSTREQVSAREAHELMEQGYAYLDVRTVPEFDTGHPPGAYNVPLLLSSAQGMQENAHFLAEVETALRKEQKLVVGCASGVRSAQAAQRLRQAGFVDVVEQRAGMDGLRDAFGRVREKGHRAEGLPVSLSPQPGRSHAELAAQARARSKR